MEESVFTKIIKGEIPAHKVYEDEQCLAFLDIHPLTAGHTLLIPKHQVDYLFDLPEATYNYLWKVARELAGPLRTATGAKRVGIIVEGFAVPHTHIHLVPMNTDQDLKHGGRSVPTEEELATMAERIRAAVAI
jgi:histidine triad (HIT) family protein